MFFVWFFLIVVLLLQLPGLMVKGRADKLAFALMWILTAVYSSLVVADINLPNFTELLRFSLTKAYQWLGF